MLAGARAVNSNWTLGGAIYERVHETPQPRTPWDYQNGPLTPSSGTVYDQLGNVIY